MGLLSLFSLNGCARRSGALGEKTIELERSTGNFSCSLYKWKRKDRTPTFAVHETDEHNVLKLESTCHEEDKTLEIREGRRRNRTEGYFFIFDGEWYDLFVNTECLKRGNITYCY